MRMHIYAVCTVAAMTVLCAGCGHTQVSKVGMMSVGNWEGKAIPEKVTGPILEGSSGAKPFAVTYSLADAVRDALGKSEYDTLVDAEVTTQTGLFVPSNRIVVKGTALNSKTIAQQGGQK